MYSVDVNQQSSNSLTNCSTNSCDSGTVLLNIHVHCKFMTKVTHSFMLILVNVHDSLLRRIYNMTLARERHEHRGKNALFRWSKLSVPSSFFDILIS